MAQEAKKMFRIVLALEIAMSIIAGNASSSMISGKHFNDIGAGNNITKPDGIPTGSALEDNEVEPNTVQGQEWDLEAFFLKNHKLTMVGGYNFKDGQDGIRSGDIFLDVDGVFAPAGDGDKSNPEHKGNMGYEYVLDLDFGALRYDVYSLTKDSYVKLVDYSQNRGSNPWAYSRGGVWVSKGEIIYYDNLDVSGTSLQGWGTNAKTRDVHDAVAVDLSFLPSGTAFTSHFTMECGNDTLVGKSAVVPEPETQLLLGTGLIALARYARKKAR